MKNDNNVPILSWFIRQLGAVFLALSAVMLVAAEPKSGSAEPKTHTLFMGADISVEYNGTMYRVLEVQTGAFIIKVDSKEVRVLADWSKVVTKVDRTLKLTDASASVTNLKSERAYTMANDPTVRFEKGLAAAAMQNAGSLAAQGQANSAIKIGSLTESASVGTQDAAGRGFSSDDTSPGTRFRDKGSLDDGEGMFDEMDVTFEVSAEEPLNNPYVVFLGQFYEKDGKPGDFTNWVYAQPLPPITREKKKVHIERAGFPRGFEMREFQLHLYNRGREIATDVAPKRVPLSRQEAFTYALLEYISSHKGATVPANAFMGKLTPEARARLNAAQLEQSYYVKVSKEGVPLGAFSDTACSHPVDGTIVPLVENVRFYPALEKGKPVEGVAELKFTRLVL